MTERDPLIMPRAFQQAATIAQSAGFSAREIKEYLRDAYGFGTVNHEASETTRDRLLSAMQEAGE